MFPLGGVGLTKPKVIVSSNQVPLVVPVPVQVPVPALATYADPNSTTKDQNRNQLQAQPQEQPQDQENTRTPNVYINGLPPQYPESELYTLTCTYGEVKSVRTFTRHICGRAS